MSPIARWMIALITVISLAGFASPADAQVVVRVGPRHHRHYHNHRHYRHHRHWR